jgi:hypothetical protein
MSLLSEESADAMGNLKPVHHRPFQTGRKTVSRRIEFSLSLSSDPMASSWKESIASTGDQELIVMRKIKGRNFYSM